MASGQTVFEHSVATPSPIHLRERDSLISGSQWTNSNAVQLPRSASHTYIPTLAKPSVAAASRPAAPPKSPTAVATTTEIKVSQPPSETSTRSSTPTGNTTNALNGANELDLGAAKASGWSQITISKFIPSRALGSINGLYRTKSTAALRKDDARSRSAPDLLNRPLNRPLSKSRFGSRSPSPIKKSVGAGKDGGNPASDKEKPPDLPTSRAPSSESDPPEETNQTEQRPKRLSRRDSVLGKKGRRPLSTIFRSSANELGTGDFNPPQSLPKSYSSDKLSGLVKAFSPEKPPALPRPLSSDSLRNFGRTSPRKKDELLSVFRGLDGEYHKYVSRCEDAHQMDSDNQGLRFQSKTSALKANVVRSSLLPFLRTYANHASNKGLRPEDLDRRTVILNRWWLALLEMLDAGSSCTLSGTDRPVILDGIIGLMTRPEWRAAPSSFAPLADQQAHQSTSIKSRSSTSLSNSLESNSSDFLAESIHHNIRNTFVQNLLWQTSIVIDKLCLRHAPASLVTFAGKAIAYSMFFCPGVADILVRLWALPPSNIRQIWDEFELIGPSNHNNKGLENTTLGFPECLQSLRFTSFASTVRHLRQRSPPVLSVRRVNWHGPWVGRWCGRDTDLFFVFVKQWHILLEEFLPADVGPQERARSPAFVPVYAQMLSIINSTIHRQAGQWQMPDAESMPATTFDDVLANADASAAAVPLPTPNVIRQMAENRMVMLLRDMLSEKCVEHDVASRTFATYFSKVLKAAARKVSKFDHDACFILCDFLEEVTFILARYLGQNPSVPDVIDWAFWLEVCKQISESENTTSEVRLFAFLYSVWGMVTEDERRKRELCLGWLLSQPTFDRFFSHWCPMTRAYYMRLLCWRLARSTSAESTVDRYAVLLRPLGSQLMLYREIIATIMLRLRSAWSHFVSLSNSAHESNSMAPSIVPSNPAPGRQIVVIPNVAPVPPSSFLSFDSLSSAGPPERPAAGKSRPQLISLGSSGSVPTKGALSTDSGAAGKKRWTLLRNIRPFGPHHDSSRGKDDAIASKDSSEKSGDIVPTRPASMFNASPDTTQQAQAKSTTNVSQNTQAHVSQEALQNVLSSYRFSLEWVDRPHHMNRGVRLYPPRLPFPAQVFLRSVQPEPPQPEPGPQRGLKARGNKYVGRALAEWAWVVNNFHNFLGERKSQGVPTDALVETPTLDVDWLRNLGKRLRSWDSTS